MKYSDYMYMSTTYLVALVMVFPTFSQEFFIVITLLSVSYISLFNLYFILFVCGYPVIYDVNI